MNEAERIGVAELREKLAKGLRLADILSCDVPITASARRELDEAKAALPALLDRIEKLEAGLQTIADNDVPRDGWSYDEECSHGYPLNTESLCCVRDFARALLTKENRILSETPHAE